MSIECTNWYRLQNAALPSSEALDTYNNDSDNGEGLVRIDTLANVSGQFWQFALQSSGAYHLSTMYLGVGKLLGVSILNNATTVHFSEVASNAGESWTVTPQTDGTYKLSSDFTGSGYYLDLCGSSNTPCFQTGNSRSQHWTLKVIGSISSSDPAYRACHSASSTTSAPTSTTPTSTPTLALPPPITTTAPTTSTEETSSSYTTTTTIATASTVEVSPLPETAPTTSIIPFFTAQSTYSESSTLAELSSASSPVTSYSVPSSSLAYTTPSGSVGASIVTTVASSTSIAVSAGAAGNSAGMGSLPLLALALLGLWRRW